jgi:hypothetical protein
VSGDGLPWAKVDSAFPQDPKVRRLERRLPHRDYLAAIGAWMLILADAWRAGGREEGVCADDLLLDPDLLDALQGTHLLDGEGRIPRSSWEKWAEPAFSEVQRRAEIRSEIAHRGGKARAASAVRDDRGRVLPGSSSPPAGIQPSAGPVLDRVQPESSRDPAGSSQEVDRDREGDREGSYTVLLTKAQLDAWRTFDEESGRSGRARLWESVKRSWMGRGFRHPPTEKQRQILWEVLDARPQDLPRWIREAPPEAKTGRAVISHVLDEWHRILREVPKDPPKRPVAGMASLGEILAKVQG